MILYTCFPTFWNIYKDKIIYFNKVFMLYENKTSNIMMRKEKYVKEGILPNVVLFYLGKLSSNMQVLITNYSRQKK